MIIEFIGGPCDGLVSDVSEHAYQFAFDIPMNQRPEKVTISDYPTHYIYRREVGSEKFIYSGLRCEQY